jgi:GNAT superfamily N-acetyltransferase
MSGAAGIEIRPATTADAQLIHDFIVELAVYEKAPEAVVTTPEELTRTLFGEDAKARALVCSVDGQPAGYAVYFYNFSTWLGRNGIWLEDVYITPGFRGRGAGKALLRHVAGIAVKENCGRFEWSVLNWNTPAIEFYEALGAKPMDEWTIYRLTGDALKKLGSA